MTSPLIVGLDLSLTSTGIAVISGEHIHTAAIRTTSCGATVTDQRRRLRGINDSIWAHIHEWAVSPDLVVIEGPSYGSQGRGTWDRAGLWWMVADEMLAQGCWLAIAPPASRCLYAAGKGNAPKDTVLAETARRFDRTVGNDEADALVLAAMGADRMGCPVVKMPEKNRAALAKVAWPDGMPVAVAA